MLLCCVVLSWVELRYVALCWVELRYVALCCVELSYVMLCYVALCCVVLGWVTLCYVMLCFVLFCWVTLCFVVLCCAMLSCVALRCVALRCVALCCPLSYKLMTLRNFFPGCPSSVHFSRCCWWCQSWRRSTVHLWTKWSGQRRQTELCCQQSDCSDPSERQGQWCAVYWPSN